METNKRCLNPECREFFSRRKDKLKNQKYCSVECFIRHAELDPSIRKGSPRMERMMYKCDLPDCNNTFEIKRKEWEDYKKHHFCSQECSNDYARLTLTIDYPVLEVRCSHCGNPKSVKMNKDNKKKKNHFCDDACFREFQKYNKSVYKKGDEVRIICVNCGKPHTYINQESRGKRKRFCSDDCRHEFKDKVKLQK